MKDYIKLEYNNHNYNCSGYMSKQEFIIKDYKIRMEFSSKVIIIEAV